MRLSTYLATVKPASLTALHQVERNIAAKRHNRTNIHRVK